MLRFMWLFDDTQVKFKPCKSPNYHRMAKRHPLWGWQNLLLVHSTCMSCSWLVICRKVAFCWLVPELYKVHGLNILMFIPLHCFLRIHLLIPWFIAGRWDTFNTMSLNYWEMCIPRFAITVTTISMRSNSQRPLLVCELQWRSGITLAFQVNVTRRPLWVEFIVGSRSCSVSSFPARAYWGKLYMFLNRSCSHTSATSSPTMVKHGGQWETMAGTLVNLLPGPTVYSKRRYVYHHRQTH